MSSLLLPELPGATIPPEAVTGKFQSGVFVGYTFAEYRSNSSAVLSLYRFGPFAKDADAIWFLGEFDRAIRAGTHEAFLASNPSYVYEV